jgi:hypothetical protein
VSAYSGQPQGGWPEQPPRYTEAPGYPGGQGYPGGAGPEYGRQARRGRSRRRGRGWIALLVILIVLAVAFVIGDQVARSYAQNMIAARFQADGFPVRPDVSIKGWPFLTQVAERDVRTVDISASNVPEGKLDIASITATASGVRINSSFNGATISSITGSALITFGSIADDLGIPGATIAADPAGGPGIASVSEGPIRTTARVAVAGPYQISLRLESIQGLPVQVPSYTLNLPRFPAGIQLSGVAVTSRGLVVSFAARDSTLSESA